MVTTRRHFHRLGLLGAAALAIVAGAVNAAAQSTPSVQPPAVESGWTWTPTLIFSTSHDSNVLVHENGDNPPADIVNVINPRAGLDFRGRRTTFSGAYDGAILLYQDFSTLNSYDQRGNVRLSHRLSSRTSLFVANTASVSPTTEALQAAGVPYVRTGTSSDDLSGGVERAFTKRTSMTVVGRLQWVHFDDPTPTDNLVLRGGHSFGSVVTLRHVLSARTALTGDYNMHHAFVAEGQADFDVMNSSIGFEHTWTEQVRLFAAGGVSHVGASTLGPARTGASYRAGFAARLRAVGFDVAYNRSFIPSFGFGGTMQNEDLTAQVHVTLSRRAYAQSSFSWRENDPLTFGEPSLNSRWVQFVGGYAIRPWVRVEGFYGAMTQNIDRPGGMLDRTRVGFQIVTTQPMRIR